jgi:hypothetical protein
MAPAASEASPLEVVEKVLTAPGPLPRRTAMQHALSQDMLDTGVAGDA